MPTFDPVAWKPPPAPGLDGPYAANSLLAGASLWETGGEGPEDIAVSAAGEVFTGLADGSILRFDTDGGTPVRLAEAGGRPLGVEILGDGELLVCNVDLGLQRVTMSGEVSVLADRLDDARFTFTNNAAVASDGTIYFTDTSTR